MKDLVNFLKMCSDPLRLRILMLLSVRELCVCELTGVLNESQPKISKHLSKMKDLGIVIDERREKYVAYSLVDSKEIYRKLLVAMLNDDDRLFSNDLEKLKDSYEQFVLKNITLGGS